MTLPDTILAAPSRADRVVALSAWMDELCAALLEVCTVGEIANALTAAGKRVVDGEHRKRKGTNGKRVRT